MCIKVSSRSQLDVLERRDNFFKMFFYIQQRLISSKEFLLEKIKQGARDTFIENRMKPSSDAKHHKIMDLRN